jgi:hypothetical protein
MDFAANEAISPHELFCPEEFGGEYLHIEKECYSLIIALYTEGLIFLSKDYQKTLKTANTSCGHSCTFLLYYSFSTLEIF